MIYTSFCINLNNFFVQGTSVITPVIPLFLVIGPGVYIACNSEEGVYEASPILYALTFCLIASKITNKLIVAHMSKSEMSNVDCTHFVPLAFLMNSWLSVGIPEQFILQVSLVRP